MDSVWRLSVDTGGTFTDALAHTPDGRVLRAKVLSSGALRGFIKSGHTPTTIEVAPVLDVDVLSGGTFHLLQKEHAEAMVVRFDPARSIIELSNDLGVTLTPGATFEVRTGKEAPIVAAHLLTRTPMNASLPEISIRLGTTLATNALLTRSGAETALFITEGFGDLLEIGTQQRPDLFALRVEKPPVVYSHVVEVPERLAADGAVLSALATAPLESKVTALLELGVETAAIALLHSDKNAAHEQALAAWLTGRGFKHVSCSSSLAQVIRIVPRAGTAVVNAYLAPVVEGYLRRIKQSLNNKNLLVMNSAGGLSDSAGSQPKDMLLSGPAGGVVGAARAGKRSGCERIISFDMGGTSTDVARYDQDYDYVFEHRVGDAHLFAPALSIETVAAGGGSICGFDGTGLFVGPASAGASPGPACYGAGGPLTVTDVNLLLGRLDPSRFGIPVNVQPA
ncbi:MAG: hydantoinase/oxoprolinase family protein, partial [Planctomycetota bacterium]